RRRAVRRRAAAADIVDEPDVSNLSDMAFQDTVNSWRGMRTCLARSTLRGTDRNGAMKVAFKIRGDGSVSNCEVVETSNSVAATIAPCVERSARRIKFPAFGGEEVEKQAKFVF
ncbi:MAG: AgmX/PglI C-terminal domain-containing protein, partial [Myxococcota bacterium]